MLKKLLFFVFLIVVLGGCSLKDFNSSLKASKYFTLKEYDVGISVFKEKIRENSNSAIDNYYLGRFYLAERKPYRALPYLKKAVRLDPEDTQYQFWLGIAFGSIGEERAERKRYEKVLELSSSHDRARLYLAHLQLKQGQYSAASKAYDKVLKRYPYNAAALYNRGLCLKFMGKKKEEKKAWLEYLQYYPSGFLASKAADHLNALGDFSYRNHQFGYRTITLKEIGFGADTEKISFDSRASLRLVGAALSNFNKGHLQVTVFSAGEKNRAKKLAVELENFILQEYPKLDENRIHLSWFGEPETLYGNNAQYSNNTSVRLYLTNWK